MGSFLLPRILGSTFFNLPRMTHVPRSYSGATVGGRGQHFARRFQAYSAQPAQRELVNVLHIREVFFSGACCTRGPSAPWQLSGMISGGRAC